jgi:hypothetical protein
MNVQIIGSRRPKLSLPFAGKRTTRVVRESQTLSGDDLRRIVAEILG